MLLKAPHDGSFFNPHNLTRECPGAMFENDSHIELNLTYGGYRCEKSPFSLDHCSFDGREPLCMQVRT